MAVPDVQEMLRLLEEGREADAIERLEMSLPRERTSAALHVVLARAYERAGRREEALRTWSTALFLMPESTVARRELQRLRGALEQSRAVTPSDTAELAATTDTAEAGAPSYGEAQPPPYTNLDRLIHDLESARIVPDPDFQGEEITFEEDDDSTLVSETLARIYAAQRQYVEAAHVYEQLAEQQPDRAEHFLDRARRMREHAEENQ